MKAKKFLSILLAVATVLTMTACGGKQEAAEAPAADTPAVESEEVAEEVNVIEFALSNCAADGTPLDAGCKKWAELLNATGMFNVTVYNNNQLGTVVDVLDRLIDGDMLAEAVSASDIADPLNIPDLKATMAPFVFTSIEDINTLTNSDWFKGLADQAEAQGVKIVAANLINGERYFITKKPVVTAADMKGMKIRVPANTNYINTFDAFGCAPTPMAVTEIYTSLQQGVVDGLEHPLPDCLKNGYHEIATNIANQDYLKEMNMLAVSTTVWNACSDAQKEALVECAFEATAYEQEYYKAAKEEALTALKEAGVNFYDIDVDSYVEAAEKYWEISTEFTPGLRDTINEILGK